MLKQISQSPNPFIPAALGLATLQPGCAVHNIEGMFRRRLDRFAVDGQVDNGGVDVNHDRCDGVVAGREPIGRGFLIVANTRSPTSIALMATSPLSVMTGVSALKLLKGQSSFLATSSP